MTEPKTIAAGDSKTWLKSLPDYKASDGWVLHYALFNGTATWNFDAIAEGDDHRVNLIVSITTTWTPGRYDWTAYVTRGAEEREVVDGGQIIIGADPASGQPYDGRTHARKMLDALEAVIEKRATGSDLDLIRGTYGERAIERDPEKLIVWRDQYKREVADEDAAAALVRGEKRPNKIKMTFLR